MTTSRMRSWIQEHDDSAIFNVLYIGLALILSITLGLFWLVVVVTLHGLLEIVRHYQQSASWRFAFAEALWEIKLDVGLILFAFVLALYLDTIFGLAGLSAGGRMAAQAAGRVSQAGNRALLWRNLIRTFFLALDDIALALRAVVSKLAGKPAAPPVPAAPLGIVAASHTTADATPTAFPQSSWRVLPYRKGEYAALAFTGACLVLIGVAPFLTDQSYSAIWATILHELRPFPAE
ncbi:MAG TPA: hypothetical protein PKA05_13245 [Roseiflexaceae bacterium]|nr:hypothetical protein [Roseiflexaceae bacterium]